MSRLNLTDVTPRNGETQLYESSLQLTDLSSTDTGLFICSYQEGSTVTRNSSTIYVYVKGKSVESRSVWNTILHTEIISTKFVFNKSIIGGVGGTCYCADEVINVCVKDRKGREDDR